MVRSYLNSYGREISIATHRYFGSKLRRRHLAIASATMTSTSILGGGDLLQQYISKEWVPGDAQKPVDWQRARRFAVMGLYQGPMLFWLYRWMDFRIVLHGGRVAVALQKAFLDLITAPAFSSVTVVGISLQEGHSLRESVDEYRRKFFSIFMLDCCTWPPFQFINFMFLPNRYRVVYTNGIQLCYNTFMSYIKHHD